MKRCAEVDRDDLVPLLDRELIDRRHVLNTGVVDEDVDATEDIAGMGDERFDFDNLGEVGAVEDGLDAEIIYEGLADSFDFAGYAQAIEDDIGPIGGKTAGDAKPDATGGPGDQRGLP